MRFEDRLAVVRPLIAAAMSALSLLAAAGPGAWAQSPADTTPGAASPPEAAEAAAEEVVVTGARTGPRLWLATRDGREIWVLGVTNTLPKGVTWDSSEVEKVMAQSDAVMRAGFNVGVSAGLGKSFGLLFKLPKLLSYTKNEDGAKLRDVLPPELYARFSRIRQTVGEDAGEYEKSRPLVAIGKLTGKYYETQNLAGAPIWTTLSKLEKKYKKKRIYANEDVSLKGIKITELAAALDAATDRIELACFDESLRFIETDAGKIRRRANAWARGDVKTLRSLANESRTQTACNAPIFEALKSDPQFSRFNVAFNKASAQVLANLDKEYGPNRRILVYEGIDKVLDKDDGLLPLLAKRGYVIEGP